MNEPAAPRAGHDARDPHGRLFWVSLVAGWALMGFGALVLVQRRGATHPLRFAVYVLGAVVAHDAVLVPIVLVLGVLAGRRLPPDLRGPVQGAAVVSGVVALVSYPLVRGFGRLADNPSLLPRNYTAATLVVLAAVWGAAAALIVVRRFRRTSGRGAEGP